MTRPADDLVTYQVDRLLLEQGQYTPLELLLLEGCLFKADCAAWRDAKLDYLDQALVGDPHKIVDRMQQAQRYVQRLGLQADPLHYFCWRDGRRNELCFSADSSVNQCFHTGYRKAPDQAQLDLFIDAPANNLVNGIVWQIIQRNDAQARRLLNRLVGFAPDHARLGELECLVRANEQLNCPVGDVDDQLRQLHGPLAQFAEALLGPQQQSFLIPHWRRLGEAVRPMRFDPSQPQRHLSYTAGRAKLWDQVLLAVENETDWSGHLELLYRHALAHENLRQTGAALHSWFRICWCFPDQADVIEFSKVPQLRQDWQHFNDMEPPLARQWFPAWWVLFNQQPYPLLANFAGHESDVPATRAYRLVCKMRNLHDTQATGPNAQLIQLRQELKLLAPALFGHYIGFLSE